MVIKILRVNYIEIGLQVSNSEIERISKYLKLTVSEFQKGYIEINEEGEKIFTDTPCKFLNDKKCSIYNIRPGDYASYPHLHKNHFIFRLFGVLSNCSICPIVFNVYEELKRELNYK